MTGKMSAAAHLGIHKYSLPQNQDMSKRPKFLTDDIQPPLLKDKARTIEKLNFLTLAAINKPSNGMFREILHKGLYKYRQGHFTMPIDYREEKEQAAQEERKIRVENFKQEMKFAWQGDTL